MTINITEIEDQVASVCRLLATNSVVIIEEGNAPVPSSSFIGIKFGTLRQLGRAEFRGQAPSKVLITRHPIEIEFRSYRDSTRTDIIRIKNNLVENPLVRDQLTAVGVDPAYTTDLVPTPLMIEDKWEQGSSFTLHALISDKTNLDLGVIETISLEGCYDTTGDGVYNKTSSTIIGEPI